MFASQLLQILQTLPASAAADEIWDFNANELEASMNRGSTCTKSSLSNQDDIQINFWNDRPELESVTFGNNFISNHEDVSFGRPPTLAKTNGFHIYKHLVEYELPELMVCYKESDFHVKDIFIDRGISDEETISTNKDNNHESICNSGLVKGQDNDDINQHPLQISKDKLGKSAIVGSVAKTQKNTFDECKIEEDVITFYFDTSKRKDSNPCESLNSESIYELPLETESVVSQKDIASGYKVAGKDHEARYVEGEASFSCSRSVPLVGDISTRSDSSANNTESFAFPILETEYASNPERMTKAYASSPIRTTKEYACSAVKMGKADKKRLKKQRGWWKGLLLKS